MSPVGTFLLYRTIRSKYYMRSIAPVNKDTDVEPFLRPYKRLCE